MFLPLNLFCAVSFIGYGASCLAASYMVSEFERFGLPGYRKLTGILQLLGAAGLLIGLKVPAVGVLAAGGLAVQMLLGFGVRLKIRDRFLQCVPAFVFMLINAWLCLQFIERMN